MWHQWITNYFCNRIQFVQIGDSKSDALKQIYGVPQGSILGPFFFILYINDLPACSNELEFTLFADDTSIFFEHSDPDVLTSHLNDQLNNVSTWLKANKLSINVKKTKAPFIRRISAMSNSVQRIKCGRNSTSESAAAFLPHVRLVLSHYPTEMRHRFTRRISAVSNSIHTLC